MIIIGEKINGTIPKTGEAIAAKDADYIAYLAKAQADAGSDYIDCCASVVDGEMEVLEWLINIIQEQTDVPISLDSPNPQSIVDAIPFCNKEGLINSISMEGDKADVVFPAIAGTNWGVVALLSDDSGIPSTAEARIEVFKRILDKADQYGIGYDRIYVDPLVSALSANTESGLVFLDTCRAVSEICPEVHVGGGLSNVSYGLPSRKSVNMPFMAYAIEAGIDFAIVDPLNRDMMGVIYGSTALMDKDKNCGKYLKAYRKDLFGPQKNA